MNHILMIDDDPGVRAFLKVVLKKEGYKLTVLESAEHLLPSDELEDIHVVISDINLPKVNGLELLEKFQKNLPDVPFIIITGDPTVSNTVEALRQGAFNYLLKPIDRNLLLSTVKKAIEMRELKLEKYRLEEENTKHRENLEIRVEERTRELVKTMEERDRMQQSLIRQERLNALGTMSSIIAHDIRNLLTPISLYVETIKIKEKELNLKSLQYLDQIQRTVSDIDDITKRIRDFSKGPDSSSGELQNVSPMDLFDRCIELCWAKKDAHVRGTDLSVELVSHISSDTPDIRVNPGEITEALINLTFNAIDALPDGGTVKLKAYSENQNVCLDVIDDGIGMASLVKDRCVEPFYSTKGERGTGLGLSSVYGIVNRNDGEFTVESAVGEGTCIRMVFPAVSS